MFGRHDDQVVGGRPTFDAAVRQLTQRLGHGTGDDSGYRRDDGRPHSKDMTANEPLSPKQLALNTLMSSQSAGTEPGLWREGPYFQGEL